MCNLRSFWTTFPDLLAHLWHRFVLAASHEAAWFQRYLTMCEYEYLELSTVDFGNNLCLWWSRGVAMLTTGNKGFGLHRLFVDKTAYLCRLGWHSHGSQYPRNSFGQTFEFKNSWGPSSKSADSPIILSALCHYTSWIIRSIVTSVFVPITPACGKTLPPLDLAKSPGIQAQLLAHQSSYKIVCEGLANNANKPSVANILLSFESMANL